MEVSAEGWSTFDGRGDRHVGVGPARWDTTSFEGVEVRPKVRSYLWVLVAGVLDFAGEEIP